MLVETGIETVATETETTEVVVVQKAKIQTIVDLRKAKEVLQAQLKQIESALKKSESSVVSLLESGADVSGCGYYVSIAETSRRVVAWKEIFEERLGSEETELILENTPPTIYRKLVIA